MWTNSFWAIKMYLYYTKDNLKDGFTKMENICNFESGVINILNPFL